MLYTHSKKKCFPLAWGTGSVFGHACTYSEASELINLLLGKGINMFDTGPSYARGKSQKLLGSCLKSSSYKREDILISTKVGSTPSKLPFFKRQKNFTKLSFEKLVKQSLNDFKTDYIDILFLHGLPKKEINKEAIDYLNFLKARGTIRFLGIAAHNKIDLKWTLRNTDIIDIVMCHYNLINHSEVESFLLSLKEKSIIVIGSTPFAGGLLSDRIKFEKLSTFKKDCFYFLKGLLPRQRRNNKKAKIVLDKIKNLPNSKNYPLEFSLNSSCIDVTLFGSLSKQSIINSTKLIEKSD